MANPSENLWGAIHIQEQRFAINDQEIACTRFGQGPALLLLHGIGSRGISWLPVASRLAESFEVIAIDQRGHGASSHPDHGYLVEDYADDLGALIDWLELPRPLVMGHSLGGMVALEWARRHPGRAAALVIEDSPMRRGGEGVAELFDGWIELTLLPVEELRARYAAENPAWSSDEVARLADAMKQVAPGVFSDLKADMIARAGTNAIPSYRAITSPALLIYGDPAVGGMVPEEDARAFAETLAAAELAHIPGGSHSLHREVTEAFLAAALPFLLRHAPAASRLDGASDQG